MLVSSICATVEMAIILAAGKFKLIIFLSIFDWSFQMTHLIKMTYFE